MTKCNHTSYYYNHTLYYYSLVVLLLPGCTTTPWLYYYSLAGVGNTSLAR